MLDGIGSVSLNEILLFAAIILPGFISMRVYSLIRPGDKAHLKDSLFEALAYGAMNLGLMSWALYVFVASENPYIQLVMITVTLAIAPIIWPFALDRLLQFLARKGWIYTATRQHGMIFSPNDRRLG